VVFSPSPRLDHKKTRPLARPLQPNDPDGLGSVLGDAWGVWTYKRRGRDKTLIAELKVRQNLKNGKI
jgi:hypothetical protein